MSDTFAPLAKDRTPLTVVGTSTSITWPRRGSLVTVRWRLRGRGLGGDPGDRPEQVDQLGHVVGPDVVDRAAAALEEELGVRVPVLHPVRQHGRGAGDRPADPPASIARRQA